MKAWAVDLSNALSGLVDQIDKLDWESIRAGATEAVKGFRDLAAAVQSAMGFMKWWNDDNAAPARIARRTEDSVRTALNPFTAIDRITGLPNRLMGAPAPGGKPAPPSNSIIPKGAVPWGRPSQMKKPTGYKPSAYTPAPQGTIKLQVSLAEGVKARVAGISSSGIGLSVNTGRAMAGPA